MTHPVIELLKKYKAGEEDLFWDIITHEKMRPIIDYQHRIAKRAFKFDDEDSSDYYHEIYLALKRKVDNYKIKPANDAEHEANAFFRYLQASLIGESERVSRLVKGMMTRDERGYSSIKGYKLSIEHDFGEGESKERFTVEDRHVEGVKNGKFARKLVFALFKDDRDLYTYFVDHYEKGLSWAEIAARHNVRPSRKLEIIALCRAALLTIRINCYMNGADVKIYALGIYTTSISAHIVLLDDDLNIFMRWSSNCYTSHEMNAVEGKVSDIIRNNDVSLIALNEVSADNKADTIIQRMLDRRSIVFSRVDVADFENKIVNLNKVSERFNLSRQERYAYVAAAVKIAEVRILRKKALRRL